VVLALGLLAIRGARATVRSTGTRVADRAVLEEEMTGP
jgi:hypothetical protein